MRLIRGRAGSGKTAQVLSEFKHAIRNDRTSAHLVVPTATLVRHFQHELARDGVVFPPNAVVSLSRFVAERANGVIQVSDSLLRVIVRDVLARLPEFGAVAGTEGMAATVEETIGLLDNSGATPDSLKAIRKLGANGKAFERIWRTVETEVRARGFEMRAGVIRAAVDNAERKKVWMDGFATFSPLELQLVASLARTCDLTVTITDSPAADEIRKLALTLRAEDRLLPGRSRRAPTEIVAASGVEREADEIARRILALRRDGGEFREVGVALRDTAAYLDLLRGTFDRFGIPARYHFGSPLRGHPAATFLGGLVQCASNGWDFSAAIQALRAHPGWGNSWEFDRFEFRVREAMPGCGTDNLIRLAGDSGWFKDRIAECLAVETWASETTTPAAWALRLEDMAEKLFRPGRTEPQPGNWDAVEAARSRSAGLRAWVETVESVVPFWNAAANIPITLAEFWGRCQGALDATMVHTPDDRRDAVHVMPVLEARQWDIAHLFVCGMTNRDFPRRAPANAIFTDAELDVLWKSGIKVRRAVERDAEETYLWELLRTRARDSLVLTYPQRDGTAKTVESSQFLKDLEAPTPAVPCQPLAKVTVETMGLAGRIESPDLLAAITAQHRTVSMTAIEDLAQCRFKFLASRTLRLRGRPERPEARLQPKITGLILHEALEEWLRAGRTTDFVELFEQAFDKACREKHLPPGYQLELKRIEFREIAKRVATEDLWTPESSEVEVELSVPFPQGITVTGRADRIDLMGGGDCVIIDYKSGRSGRIEGFIESPTKLQGPLYALAAREQFGLNTIAMMYVAVREDKRFGWGEVPGVDLSLKPMPERWVDDARERASGYLGTFLSGNVKPVPTDTAQCVWCDFKNTCHVEQTAALVMTIGGVHVD